MSEFERECEEYECPPIRTQWDNVVDMLLAQSEPKNHKKEKKIWEKKWSQICIENGWDNYIRVEKTKIYHEIGFVGYLDIIQVADVVIQIVKLNY